MRFELHCHSIYSLGKKIPVEGLAKPREIIKHAKRIGLSGIAITDHNNSNSWKEASKEAKKQGIVFIPSIEISTNNGRGHVIGLGLNEHIEKNLGIEETIDRIREQGGIAVAPHPFDTRGHGLKSEIKKADVVEVFNAMALDKIGNLIAEIKADKFGLGKVAGSDAHALRMIGTATVKSSADDMDSLLKHIKNGYVEIEKRYIPVTEIVKWSWERVSRSRIQVLNYITNNYWAPKKQIAGFMFKKFLNSPESRVWGFLARFGLLCTRTYSMVVNSRYLVLD